MDIPFVKIRLAFVLFSLIIAVDGQSSNHQFYIYIYQGNGSATSIQCADSAFVSSRLVTAMQIQGPSSQPKTPCYCLLAPGTGSFEGTSLNYRRYENGNWASSVPVNIVSPGFAFQVTGSEVIFRDDSQSFETVQLGPVDLSGFAGGGGFWTLKCGSSRDIAFPDDTTTSTSTESSTTTQTTTTESTTSTMSSTTARTTTTSTTTTPTTTTSSTTTTTTPTTTTTTPTTTTTTPTTTTTTPTTTTTTPTTTTATPTTTTTSPTTTTTSATTTPTTTDGTTSNAQTTTTDNPQTASPEKSSKLDSDEIIIIVAVCVGAVGLLLIIGLIILACIFCSRRRNKSDDEEDKESRYEEIVDPPVKPASYEVMDQREDLYAKAQRVSKSPTEESMPSPAPSNNSAVSMGHSTDHDDVNLIAPSNGSDPPSLERGQDNQAFNEIQVNPLYGQEADFQESSGPTPASTIRTLPKDAAVPASEAAEAVEVAAPSSSAERPDAPSDSEIAGYKQGLLSELSGRFPDKSD